MRRVTDDSGSLDEAARGVCSLSHMPSMTDAEEWRGPIRHSRSEALDFMRRQADNQAANAATLERRPATAVLVAGRRRLVHPARGPDGTEAFRAKTARGETNLCRPRTMPGHRAVVRFDRCRASHRRRIHRVRSHRSAIPMFGGGLLHASPGLEPASRSRQQDRRDGVTPARRLPTKDVMAPPSRCGRVDARSNHSVPAWRPRRRTRRQPARTRRTDQGGDRVCGSMPSRVRITALLRPQVPCRPRLRTLADRRCRAFV